MNFQRSFYDNELRLYYYVASDDDANNNIDSANSNNIQFSDYYRLTVFRGGPVNIIMDGKRYSFTEPVLVVFKPGQNYSYRYSTSPFSILKIQIHPKMLENIDESDMVLEFFYKLNAEQRIFKLSEPKNTELDGCVDFIIEGLFARCGRFSMHTRTNMLIAEINLIYETHYKGYIASTDNISVQIMDYIERHYLEDISAKKICELFFISYNTLNSTVKSFTGKTFWDYVTSLKLSMANKLIESEYYTLNDVASLAGFKSYPAFFQAYKKHFGSSPTQRSDSEKNS